LAVNQTVLYFYSICLQCLSLSLYKLLIGLISPCCKALHGPLGCKNRASLFPGWRWIPNQV